MAVVGAAAAAEHVEPAAEPRAQGRVVLSKLGRVADVEIGRRVELGVAALRGVGTQALDPRGRAKFFACVLGDLKIDGPSPSDMSNSPTASP